MSFDIEKMFKYSVSKIKEFLGDHQDETFYAFAIDANLLCFNSLERFTNILNKYQLEWDSRTRHIDSWSDMTEDDHKYSSHLLKLAEKYDNLDINDKVSCLRVINESRQRYRMKDPINPYRTEEKIADLKENTGDWAYQGFAELDDANGFDYDAYSIHYDLDDNAQKNSEYSLAMNELVRRLNSSGIFDRFTLTEDFYATKVEHNY